MYCFLFTAQKYLSDKRAFLLVDENTFFVDEKDKMFIKYENQLLSFMLAEDILLHQKRYGCHVNQHADNVVGNGDKWSGCYGRVYFEFLQNHRD